MVDNVTLNKDTVAGGAVVAADDIAAVKYQRIKFTLGADGVNDGDVHQNNPLPGLTLNKLVPVVFDYIELAQNATQDIYTYKTGGAGGTTVRVVTITFTDSTKQVLDNVNSV
jgi:hypothetical protein